MLFQMVDRICRDIDALPFPTPPAELAQQIWEHAPDAIREIIQGNRAQGKALTEAQAADTLALVAYVGIKSVPRSARAMAERVNDRRLSAAQRCAIASILAYLVQPHDFIRDDAPGYYGYLDDAIMVQAGLVAYLDTYPAGMDVDRQQKIANFLMGLTPAGARQQIQLGIASLSTMVHLLSMLGSDAEGILQLIIANPLAGGAGAAAPTGFGGAFSNNFANGFGGSHQSGFFGRSGAWVEGNSIVMPGGGGLINGELFIPS